VPALGPFDRGEPAQRVDDGVTVTLAEHRGHREAAGESLEFLGVDVVKRPGIGDCSFS